MKIALDGGVQFIQYREKEHSRRETFFIAEELRKITGEYDCTYIVNDHADIALAVGADGVHLGQDDLPLEHAKKIMGNKIIGISTHSLEEAMNAEEGGADYIGFGPMYHTTTKDAGSPKGPEMLKEIRKNIQIP
ncbi:MAG: thiamine phosphate synthase, partial [Thermodesulfovibrionales bacterium]